MREISSETADATLLTVTGDLNVSPRARLDPSIRASGNVTLGRDARLAGNLEAGGLVRIEEGVHVGGRVACQRAVWDASVGCAGLACEEEFLIGEHVLARRLHARDAVVAGVRL